MNRLLDTCTGGARLLRLTMLATALCAAGVAANATADVIFFSSRDDTVASANFGNIPGHGQPPNASVPGFSWNYSGNYADPRLPVQHGAFFHGLFNDHLCISPSGGLCASDNNDGVAGNEYLGFEFIYFTFHLPANAVNIKLIVERWSVDDRGVLGVNGTQIGGFSSGAAPGGTTVPNMRDGAGVHSVLFLQSVPQITDQNLFHAGENHLYFWINNTGSGLSGPAKAHLSIFDPSAIDVRGGISFDVERAAAPEPVSLALLGVGLFALGLMRSSRGRRRAAIIRISG